MLLINNIRNINPNNKPFVYFKKSEGNKTQENKKVPSTTEIVLGVTTVAALGVATFALISSHKNKKEYEKILDEKISKKLDEKSSKIIDSKVTQKVNETINHILDGKIKKIVEDKTSEIVENKFSKDFYNKFIESLKLFLKNTTEELRKSPKYKELMKELKLIIEGIEAWVQQVNQNLGFIDNLQNRSKFISNFSKNSWLPNIQSYFPNFF